MKNNVLVLDGEIDLEMMQTLAASYSDMNPDTLVGPTSFLDIYIRSGGGDNSIGIAMTDLVNTNECRTTLIAMGGVFSGAFELFFMADCEKRILPCTVGMYHYGAVDIVFRDNNAPQKGADEAYLRTLESVKKRTDYVAKICGFTKEEIEKLEAGEDVGFDYMRMLEMLEFSKGGLSVSQINEQ